MDEDRSKCQPYINFKTTTHQPYRNNATRLSWNDLKHRLRKTVRQFMFDDDQNVNRFFEHRFFESINSFFLRRYHGDGLRGQAPIPIGRSAPLLGKIH